MSKIKFTDLLTTINEAPTGGFVGVKAYESKTGDVSDVLGRLGCSYDTVRKLSIVDIKAAIDAKAFIGITVEGKCYQTPKGEWNPRKFSCPLKSYKVDYTADEVLESAKAILEAWEAPKPRKSNKTNLSDKENGLVFNTETGTFNFSLMVESQTFIHSVAGEVAKPKAKAPETKLKETIRAMFEKKIKSFTIAEGKFSQLAINGKKYESTEITF